MQVWQMVRALFVRGSCEIIKNSNCQTQHGENCEVHLLSLNTSYNESTFELFLVQAENIYNDEDPEGAADSEVQA